jgi:pimeloyl-ACP methyl ester carboxylesterase
MTTANTARDMDVIRQGLGEDKLNYFAWSYGSYLGAVYASLYPGNTDRVVIDSVVDPNWVWRTQFRKWGLGGQMRWPDFANWAASNDATYHFGSTPDQVTATYEQLLSAADAHPFADTFFYNDGTLINGPIFQGLTFDYLANDGDFATTARLWQDTQQAVASASASSNTSAAAVSASRGAGTDPANASHAMGANAIAAITPADSPGPTPVAPRDIVVPADNSAMSGMVVLCDDAQWSRVPGQYQAELQQDIQSYPLFGAFGSNIWECAFWPNAPVESPVQITANGPANILMVQNLRDPNTPYPGALEMHTALGQRSRLVTVDHGGHAIFGLEADSVCAASFITAYLADGVFPDQDEFCPATTSTAAAAQNAPGKDQVREALLRQMSGHHSPRR